MIMQWLQRTWRTARQYAVEPDRRRVVLLWLLLLSLAPFAIEIILLADLIGIELAMAFLAYYVKAVLAEWQAAWRRFRCNVRQSFLWLSHHSVGQLKTWLLHSSCSLLVLVFTGSALWAMLLWYPVVILGQHTPSVV